MSEILAMAMKDLRILARDRVGVFFVVVFPFLYALFIGSIFSTGSRGGGGFDVVVADEDNTDASRAFIAKLDENKSVKVVPATREDAAREVRLGHASAYLVVPAGFGAARANPFLGKSATVELGADPARVAEGAMLEGMIMQLGFGTLADQLSKPDARTQAIKSGADALHQAVPDAQAAQANTQRFLAALSELDQLSRSVTAGRAAGDPNPLFQPLVVQKESVAMETRKGPRNSFEYSFPQGISWAFLFCVTRFAASLVGERARGTLIRMQVAPLTRWHIIGGKALACILAMTSVGALLYAFAAKVLDVHVQSVPLFALAAACSVLCFTGIMVFISTLGKTEEAAAGIGSAIMLIMTMTGGGAVPLLAMPPWMQSIASISPVKWAILALEGSIWRGFTPAEMITPCVILLATGAVTFAIGTRLFRWHAA